MITAHRSLLMSVVVTLALAPALVGCRRAEPAPPGATVREETTTTTTTAPPIDVSRVPDEVTVEYADAVMDALDGVLGDAIREMVRAQGPTLAFRDRLNAIYDEPEFSDQESDFGSLAAKDLDAMKERSAAPA